MIKQNPAPLIVIAGPTGVGKTDLSLKLAAQLPVEIINGDSMQVYQGLDIGTGKASPEERKEVPHHLLDWLPVDRDYSASDFKSDAQDLIQEIYARGKLPMVVGGSGLYIQGLLYDMEFGYRGSHDTELRQSLEAWHQRYGDEALYDKVQAIDPVAVQGIPKTHSRRLIRVWQVYEATGQLFSQQAIQGPSYDFLLFVLDRPRPDLYQRINRRVDMMADQGLEREARWLFSQPGSQDFQSSRGIGYKEWLPYFRGQVSRDEVIQQIQQNSRRYAKRQLTWFRNRFKEKIWFDLSHYDQDSLVQTCLDIIDKTYQKRSDLSVYDRNQ